MMISLVYLVLSQINSSIKSPAMKTLLLTQSMDLALECIYISSLRWIEIMIAMKEMFTQ